MGRKLSRVITGLVGLALGILFLFPLPEDAFLQQL